MHRILICLTLLALAGCADVHPAGPGHEPPTSGTVNPVSGTRSNGGS